MLTPTYAGVTGAAPLLPQVQPAGARIGPFANPDFWSGPPGIGAEWQNNRTFVIPFWRSGAANNQTLWAFNTATSGWFLIHGNARNLLLFFRGVGGGSVTISTTLYFGLNCLAITQRGVGSIHFSMNGGPAALLAAPGAYTPAGALAIHAVGKNQGEATFAATQSSILAQAIIEVGATDAELQLWSSSPNVLDRWHLHPAVSTHPSASWIVNWQDWDGASATFTGTGSAPFTLTRSGTGGGKTTMPSYLRYRIPRRAVWDNAYWRNIAGGRNRHSIFAQTRFVSSAIDTVSGPAGLVVELLATISGVVANSNAGIRVNGVNLAGNNQGVEPDIIGVLRAIDVPGIPAGAGKAFVVTDGSQSENYPDMENVRCAAAQFIRVPVATPLVWTYKTPPTEVMVNVSDSLFTQVVGLNSVAGIKGPPYDAWPMKERANWPARRIACEGWGFGTWFERISTAAKRTAFVAQLSRLAIGTTSNWFWMPLGTNDYGLNTYALLATFEADLVAAIQLMLAQGWPDTKIYVVSPTARTGEATNNPSGWNLPDMRTAQNNAVTTVADVRVIYVDASAYVSAANRPDPDGLHFNTAGHVQYEAAARLVLGY